MSAVGDRSEFKIQDGKIYRWMEGRSYYDVDWGMTYERGYYYVVCDDTPENRAYYHLTESDVIK
jgi:hypothetical protein